MPKFAIEGREYEYDRTLTIKEAMFIQEKAMVGGLDLWPALDRRDPRAVAAFMYTLKRRNKEAVRWEDMLSLDLLSYTFIPDPEPEDAEGEAEGKESDMDPTSKSGKTRKAATKSIG